MSLRPYGIQNRSLHLRVAQAARALVKLTGYHKLERVDKLEIPQKLNSFLDRFPVQDVSMFLR